MTRPPRIEFPGAIYHVTSRGNRQAEIFLDTTDRQTLLKIVDSAFARFDAAMLAYCLMGNHYHFVLLTRRANLSRLMREINGCYSQAFNARHRLSGHVLQGRYNAIVVDSDAYFATVSRYVELNPVRAGIISNPADWPWSSYCAHVGRAPRPRWLDTPALHAHLLGRPVATSEERQTAWRLYAEFVQEGAERDFWDRGLRQDLFLGDQSFVDRVHALALPAQGAGAANQTGHSSNRMDAYLSPFCTRGESMRLARVQGGMTIAEIARQVGVSASAVSRAIAKAEARLGVRSAEEGSGPASRAGCDYLSGEG